MNWYLIYKLAMALPQKPEDGLVWGIGPNRIDQTMTDQSAEQERKRFPNISYLGGGDYGIAFDVGSDKVAKYTIMKKEAEMARFLMGKENEYPVAKIFGVELIQETPRKMWVIIMEKVRTLDGISDKEYTEVYPKIHIMQNQLLPIGLDWDAKFENIGRTADGRLVLFDIQPQSFPYWEPPSTEWKLATP